MEQQQVEGSFSLLENIATFMHMRFRSGQGREALLAEPCACTPKALGPRVEGGDRVRPVLQDGSVRWPVGFGKSPRALAFPVKRSLDQ